MGAIEDSFGPVAAARPPTAAWRTIVPSGRQFGEDPPRVEVVGEPLCSASEVRQAVIAGALASGLFGLLVGIAVGYALGLRDGGAG